MALVSVFALGRSDPPMVAAPVVNAGQEELARAKLELAAAMGGFEDAPKVVPTETIRFNDTVLTPPPEQKTAEIAEKKSVKIDHGPCAKNTHRKRKVWINSKQWRCMR